MLIKQSIVVAQPIDKVWSLIADDFTNIHKWFDSVVSAEELTGVEAQSDAPVAGRVCKFSADPDGLSAREAITGYDKQNHTLEFEVVPVNASSLLPLTKNNIRVTLSKLSDGETELQWHASPELKAHGYMVYPMLKLGLGKGFGGFAKGVQGLCGGKLKSASPVAKLGGPSVEGWP